MTQTTVPASGAPAALSLPQRVLGVIVSPQPTFESVAAHPKWFDVLALVTLISAVAWFAFLSTDVGRLAFTDNQLQSAERWGQTITPEVEQNMAAQAPFMRIFVPISVLVLAPLMTAVIAGVGYGLFTVFFGGGSTTYKQVFAVVTHAGVITTVAGLGVLVLNYVRETMSSATNLAVFVQMLPEESFLVRFLGMIDLVWVWYLVVLAIGLAVLYRRKPGSIAFAFLGLYLVIALIIAGVRSALGGS